MSPSHTTIVPNAVILAPSLGIGPRAVMDILLYCKQHGAVDQYGDDSTLNPSMTTIADMLGCSAPSVRRYVAELVAMRFITIEPREGRAHAYFLCPDLRPSRTQARSA